VKKEKLGAGKRGMVADLLLQAASVPWLLTFSTNFEQTVTIIHNHQLSYLKFRDSRPEHKA